MDPRRFAWAVPVTLAAACTGAPPPPPQTAHIDVGAPAAPVPLPLSARWVQSGGATLIGPTVPSGTFVLLGGRRAVVHPDGALETEKAPLPEPIEEILEVPGAGSRARLIGRGAHGVYRFDDPLGAPVVLARTEDKLAHLGAGPGVIAVWTIASELPRFLDVDAGREQKLAGLPGPPLRALAFADEKRGAAVFEAVGLAVTGDGGATWRLAAETAAGDALRMSGLRARGGAVRAFAYPDGPDGAVDLDGGRLGAVEPQRPPPAEARLLRWIRATGRDPLEAVAGAASISPAAARWWRATACSRASTRGAAPWRSSPTSPRPRG